MKRFLLNIITFCLLLVTPLVILIGVKYRGYYDTPEDRNVLIIGDSHLAFSCDDEIFERSVNLGYAGEPTLTALMNLRAVMNGKNDIDTVVLSFWSETLAHKIKSLSEEEENTLNDRMMYTHWEDLKETNESLFYLFKPTILSLLYSDDKPLGRYYKMDKFALQRHLDEVEAEHGKGYIPPCKIYKEGLQYDSLLKIRELCEKNGVTLILMSGPVYNADVSYNQTEFVRLLRDSLDGFTYVDHSYFPLSDSCYADMGHTNIHGARLFSEHLDRYGLLQGAKVYKLGE